MDQNHNIRDHPKSLCAQQKEGCDQDPTVGKSAWQLDPALLAAVGFLFLPLALPLFFLTATFSSCPSYLAFYNIYILCHVNL